MEKSNCDFSVRVFLDLLGLPSQEFDLNANSGLSEMIASGQIWFSGIP